MSIILKHRTQFTCDQYDNVSNISYDSDTKIYTITYGNGTITSYSGNDFILFIMAN